MKELPQMIHSRIKIAQFTILLFIEMCAKVIKYRELLLFILMKGFILITGLK